MRLRSTVLPLPKYTKHGFESGNVRRTSFEKHLRDERLRPSKVIRWKVGPPPVWCTFSG